MLQIKIFQVNPLGTNCIVLWEDGTAAPEKPCALVDPGFYRAEEEEMVLSFLKENGLCPDAVLLTHAHFDHTWGVASVVRRFGCPVYLSAADDPILRSGSSLLEWLHLGKGVELFDYQDITDGQTLQAGGASWLVIATPGHTPGCVGYYCAASEVLLSGDTLFAGSIGRTDLEGGDYDALMHSILDKLMVLPGETDVVPGHGGCTTIARESTSNPFLQPFNEPDAGADAGDGIVIDGI